MSHVPRDQSHLVLNAFVDDHVPESDDGVGVLVKSDHVDECFGSFCSRECASDQGTSARAKVKYRDRAFLVQHLDISIFLAGR